MGHRKKHAPHRGSLGYRRTRTKRHTARWRTWPDASKTTKPRLMGFAGYKAGMTHLAMINTNTRSPFFKQEQFVPVTVLETPPVGVFGVRAYGIDNITKGLCVRGQIWGKSIDKDLERRIKTPKEKQDTISEVENIRKVLDEIKEIRVLVHTIPREAGSPQKTPDILEIKVDGPVKEAFDYAVEQLDKKIEFSDVYRPSDFIDINATTKGKGFAGPIKRHGVKILPRKKRKGRRVVGCIGPWHPARVMWTVPRAGQLGYFARTEYNKQILKIGEDGEEVTPANGFKRYGKVSKHCLIKGSIAGPPKRMIRIRDPARLKPVAMEDLQITYISTEAKN